MTSALERLVERTLANGEISDKEQNVLIAKAHALGIGVDELDFIIRAKIEQSGMYSNIRLILHEEHIDAGINIFGSQSL